MLGAVVDGHHLVTLKELADEAKDGTPLVVRNGWLAAKEIQADIRNSILSLPVEKQKEYESLAEDFILVGDGVLSNYCTEKNIPIRTLSFPDAMAIAVATDIDAILATDEWPLRLVANSVELDDGKKSQLFSTLNLLKLFENANKITRIERIDIVKDWLRSGEKLLKGWENDYQSIFGELAPTVQ